MQLALFDFDHTITTTDTYSRFLRRVARLHSATAHGARWDHGWPAIALGWCRRPASVHGPR